MCWYFQWTYEECGHTVSDKTNRCVERNKGNKCGPEGDQLDPWPENRKGVCPVILSFYLVPQASSMPDDRFEQEDPAYINLF
jgi:hypothetical protein